MKKISYILIIVLYIIIAYRIIDIKYLNNKTYYQEYLLKSNNVIEGTTPKRGRILDQNSIVLVDNQAIYNINYRIIKNTNTSDMINTAKIISNTLNLTDEASIDELKRYYILTNETNSLLTSDELELYKYRKLNDNDIYNIKYNRIDEYINNYNEQDKVNIHTFYLMNKGYIYDTKLIKNDVSYNLCVSIEELNIKGLSCDISYKRVINYPIISSILGEVGKIPAERKEEYLSIGYTIDDIVGISGLEEYYDNTLKGTKAKYMINKDNSLSLIEDEVSGEDLHLSLDINLINKSYEILKENFLNAEKLRNTSYFKEAYIIISKPYTGEIVSIMGLQKNKINNEITLSDISSKAMLSSYTVGSIVKGASHTVGYLNNSIDVGKKINDSCVKLYLVPEKCSYVRLGLVDDISALKTSSNYYQFITAIKTTGNNYSFNMKLNVDESNFNKYRDVFKLYGLGDTTYIDFPKESIGIKGKTIAPDLLLNLAIGQYDNYTPLQVVSYINTIATKGERYALSFKMQQNQVVDTIDLDEEYMNRIHEGFRQVLTYGTGKGYVDQKYNPAGKTGTAESYINKDIIGINSSFIMFAPINEAKYSVVVLTPNVAYESDDNNYTAPINMMISKSITDYLFENY